MVTETPDLSSLARSKLHLSVGSKERCSLHRWVLLKNSIIRSLPLTTTSLSQSEPALPSCNHHGHTDVDIEDEDVTTEETDSFMFPDAEKFVDNPDVDVSNSEAQWLDSLLETLGDDEDSDFGASQADDDDEETLLSPLLSPMSSSDDLTSDYYSHSASTYPVPYPPFHPPLIRSYDDTFDDSLFASAHDHPFPYYDEDDVSDLPVPDAIEDTSDDESDAPLTPSIERGSYGQNGPHVFIHTSDSCFYPHSQDLHLSYTFHHQEC